MNAALTVQLVVAALAMSAATPAFSHRLNVFASTDCTLIHVEAKFSNGRHAVAGKIRVRDGNNTLLLVRELGEDGSQSIPLAELDATTGLTIDVDAGGHNDYWILTPEDIAKQCQS